MMKSSNMQDNNLTNKMLEPEIKAMVLNKLLATGKLESRPLVVNELTLNNFSRRVDLALFEKKTFTAFEIKSEADSLNRLEGQLKTYTQYFDKVIVVAASKHISQVLKTVPENVGIWEVRGSKIVVIKRGKIQRLTTAKRLIQMMKVVELSKLVTTEGLSLKNKNRKVFEKALLKIPVTRLKKHAFQSLYSRFETSLDQFYGAIQDRNIIPNDLDLLSRFKASSSHRNKKDANRKEKWAAFREHPDL